MKTLRYTTKAESNAERERAFLALSSENRLAWFLSHSGQVAAHSRRDSIENSESFVLLHKDYGKKSVH